MFLAHVERASFADAARSFCAELPHTADPYNSRAWGHPLHSLCSYQGKLKPAIAALLVQRFTSPGDRVLDPLSGAGTIPLEAHLQGRIGIGNDLQELGYILTLAKVSNVGQREAAMAIQGLARAIASGECDDAADTSFGFNGSIAEYFDPATLSELVSARAWVKRTLIAGPTPAEAFVITSLMHVLHGNRPYALSRTSHPVTPFKPQGDVQYKSVIEKVSAKVARALGTPKLPGTINGSATLGDFRDIRLDYPVDVIVTSPPFVASTRFYIANWMRLWLCGWDRSDFSDRGERFLETQQRKSRSVYSEFFAACHKWLRPGGTAILHLGRTKAVDMAGDLAALASPAFEVVYSGEEDVLGREKFGVRDQGATHAHQYLFLKAR